ncbi:unnamed protein product [Dicrocoelium dendriticum]|nr:unnamed protein product [Dicrocoelium dendriticum]
MVSSEFSSDSGLRSLDAYLLTRSYIEGYQPSQADCVVYRAVSKKPDAKYENALRWYNHIDSFGAAMESFPGQAKPLASYGITEHAETTPTTKASTVEDDVDDLFGSDSGDEAEAERLRAERQAAADAMKAAKSEPVAKSVIVLDVKPWDDETDMVEIERRVREIKMDGLLWGASKFVPLAYGIKKLQIGCVVEDDKVGTDILEEEIMKLEDLVQSVDIASFQKV